MTDYAPREGMTETEIDAAVSRVVRDATLEEKVAMMAGQGFYKAFKASGGRWGSEAYRAGGGCERLGVPALYFTDGPRGVALGNSTCFPVTMARGASFDVDLERRIGEVMGIEARVGGATLSGAVCVNLLRHPGWGRAQETYGEDPHHLGVMGAALAQGIQTHNVMATVKHYALNSIENARFKIDVQVDARTLREVYLPHFKHIVDAGCASVMSAYNRYNGEYCGQHRELLTDILRDEWGFDGFVHSDWVMGVYQPYGAAAGLDIENPEPRHFGDRLISAVRDGQIEPAVVDQAVRRILTVSYRFAAAQDPLPDYPESLVACAEHRDLAREAALKSAVLLRNDGILPLERDQKLALFGRLAALVNTGDNGSSRVQPPYVITALEGLQNYLDDPTLTLAGDETDPARAAEAAGAADVAVVVVGLTAKEEGEYVPGDIALGQENGATADQPAIAIGGDREDLSLPADQLALIAAVSAANPRTIVILIAGSVVHMTPWHDQPAAILQTFYSGMEGGCALAQLLFGQHVPSGRLPFTVAEDPADYPFFDKNADAIAYGPLHGYTLFEQSGKRPLYPFGFGLSYTTFEYRALRVRKTPTHLQIEVSVANTGQRAAEEVVQIYIGAPGQAVVQPPKKLQAFARLQVDAGQVRTARFDVLLDQLRYWCATAEQWLLEPGQYRVFAGTASDAANALSRAIDI